MYLFVAFGSDGCINQMWTVLIRSKVFMVLRKMHPIKLDFLPAYVLQSLSVEKRLSVAHKNHFVVFLGTQHWF